MYYHETASHTGKVPTVVVVVMVYDTHSFLQPVVPSPSFKWYTVLPRLCHILYLTVIKKVINIKECCPLSPHLLISCDVTIITQMHSFCDVCSSAPSHPFHSSAFFSFRKSACHSSGCNLIQRFFKRLTIIIASIGDHNIHTNHSTSSTSMTSGSIWQAFLKTGQGTAVYVKLSYGLALLVRVL